MDTTTRTPVVRSENFIFDPYDRSPREFAIERTPLAYDDPLILGRDAKDCFRVNRYGR